MWLKWAYSENPGQTDFKVITLISSAEFFLLYKFTCSQIPRIMTWAYLEDGDLIVLIAKNYHFRKHLILNRMQTGILVMQHTSHEGFGMSNFCMSHFLHPENLWYYYKNECWNLYYIKIWEENKMLKYY